MMKPIPTFDHWLSDPKLQDLLLTPEQVIDWNEANMKNIPELCDLVSLPPTMMGSDICKALEAHGTNNITKYFNAVGEHFSEDYVLDIQSLINFPHADTEVKIQYGLAIERCSLRSYPTDETAMGADIDLAIDRFQETAIYPLEPVVILHHSADYKWHFVQTYNYTGWVHEPSIVTIRREDFLKTFRDGKFWYVTQDFLTIYLKVGPTRYNEIFLQMGSRIPAYLLEKEVSEINLRCNLNREGIRSKPYACSLENLVTLALRCLGQPYDWGGKKGYRDCSALITDIFRCLGLIMPRNAGQQAKCGTPYDGNPASLIPGCLIFIPGHVMIYLGMHDDEHYVIHSVKEFWMKDNGTLIPSKLSGVQITPLDIYRQNGDSYMAEIYAVCEIEQKVTGNR